jgi:putative component of toxin-antitoxin plasmid stabilization module
MRGNAYMPPVLKDKDTYLMAASHNFKKMCRLSIDGLAATIDYYTKYQKALNNEEAKNTLARRLEEAKEWLGNPENDTGGNSFLKRFHESVIRGELKVKSKPVRLLSPNRMTHSQMKLFSDNGLKKQDAWNAYRTIKEEVRQKMLDMSCQIEDLQSSYTKGTETSYGDTNTNNSLKEKYGVLVKRQNGNAINREEIKDIASALDKIGGVFGDLKKISEGYGLKISHAGGKHMFARRFTGLFFDVHKAIGVSFSDKDTDFLILSHEYAHFLDAQAEKGLNHFFASDKPLTAESAIAREFRSVMNKRETRTIESKYLNRTCECFARAMEQYTAYKVSPEQFKQYCGKEAYAGDGVFKEKIAPLVETLLVERHDLWHCVPPDPPVNDGKITGSPAAGTNPQSKKPLSFNQNTSEISPKTQ